MPKSYQYIMNHKEIIIDSYTERNDKFNKNINIKINKSKHIDHPYYSPLVLTKKERYKVFTNNDLTYKLKKKDKNTNILTLRKNNEFGILTFSMEDLNKQLKSHKEIIGTVRYKKIL